MIETGTVVKSIAGHDKNRFYCIVAAGPGGVFIADGKSRPLEKPKRKNEKHLRPTNAKLNLDLLVTDKKLRCALAAWNRPEAPAEDEGGN